ncbi:MAG: hypothetical protein GKC06_05030 [Methanomicrobiales archaeon]|nr:hypothetical protein [Methanomicrobiales archaeon]
MQKSEIRHKQWEIADSLCSYLKTGKVLVGQVNDIITTCDIQADGYTVAKFLERAQSMAHSPFHIKRTFDKKVPHRRLTYHVTLKAR